MSLCFKNPFTFDGYDEKINQSSYLKFLQGTYFAPEMLSVNYDNITDDMSIYITEYYIRWRNGSSTLYPVSNDSPKLVSLSYNGFFHGSFFKCYAIQVPHDKHIEAFHLGSEEKL